MLGGARCDKCQARMFLVVFVGPLKISTDGLTFGTSCDLIVTIYLVGSYGSSTRGILHAGVTQIKTFLA